MIKAVLLDFDGTLVVQDMLDVACEINGKRLESEKLNSEFHKGNTVGLDGLIQRINLLTGVSVSQIEEKILQEPCLATGAKDLLDFLNSNGIITILNSGNIVPILDVYKKILSITYIIGTNPIMQSGVIMGISQAQFSSPNYKLDGINKILYSLKINSSEVIAIGDSPADKNVFNFAGKSIAINPKGDVGEYADYIIQEDLTKAIGIIKSI